jgi:aspartate aminotransferase-like enzyme
VPDQVLKAVGQQMINHRGPEFQAIQQKITEGLKKVFVTKNDVLVLTSSGTGGLEAAMANTLSPGERVVIISIGEFGERLIKIAKAYGADVVPVSFPYGTAADPDKVRQVLKSEPKVETVYLTHNETSTGVTNDLQSLAKVIKGEFNKTLVVDGVSSISSIPLPVDEWGIDIAVSGSQKGWMTPPGLAMLSVSPKAWQVIEKSKSPKFYFDLKLAKASAEKGETPWTPAISIYYGLAAGLDILLKEGMGSVYERHASIGAHTRQAIKKMGLELFVANERYASNTVTAIKIPEGVDWKAFNTAMRKEHGVVLGGGQGAIAGKIFRIGHLGYFTQKEIDDCLKSVQTVMTQMGGFKAAPTRSA